MPIYSLKAPNGKTYEIEGPEGASQEDVQAEVLRRDPSAAQASTASTTPEDIPMADGSQAVQASETKKGYGDIFSESIEKQGGWAPMADPSNTGILPLDTINNAATATGVLGLRGIQGIGAGLETGANMLDDASRYTGLADLPELTKGMGMLDFSDNKILPGTAVMSLFEASPSGGINSGVGSMSMLGKAGLAANRTQLLEEGRNLIRNGATRAELDAWTDANKLERFGEDLDPYLARRDAGKPVQDIKDVYGTKVPLDDVGPVAASERLPEAIPVNAALEAEAKAFKPSREPNVGDLWKAETPVDEAGLAARLEEEASAFKARREQVQTVDVLEEATTKIDDLTAKVDEVVADINRVTNDWKNPPEIEVHKNFDDLQGVDNDAIGVTTPEGKVLINASKVDGPEVLNAVTFHEALSHNGMTQLFGTRLDKTLESFYNKSNWFRGQVDDWMERNKGAYEGSVARAADEVLAELSEAGTVHAEFNTLKNRIKNQVIGLARKMGMTKDMSEREISTILAMAHDAVINGKQSPMFNGFKGNPSRYMMKARPKKTLSPESMSTQNDVSDLLDFTAKKLEGEKQEYTIPELKRMADDIGLNTSKYLKQKGFTEEKLAARLLAAKQLFTNTSEELAGLGEKLRTEGYSPSLHANIRAKLAQQEAIAAKLDGDSAEAGRALRVLREITESRKSAQAQSRYMAEHGSADVLSDPATLMRFMDNYTAIGAVEGEAAAVKFLRKMRKNNPIIDVLNIPRSIMSSVDLSAPFRQGLFLVGRKEFWKAYPEMFKYFANEQHFKELGKELRRRPNFGLMMKSGLALSDDAVSLSAREEQFMSRLAGKLPLVKHSERAYTGFLTKLRADVFDTLVEKSKAAGIDLVNDKKALKDISSFVNNATGRGDLGFLNSSAPLLNSIFFSPRLIASRVNLLNPHTYIKLSPVVRKEAIKSLLSLGAIATTVASLAYLGGANIETDPRSSDFAKIKVNDTRYDILGGFGQYLTLGSRLVTNEKKAASGKIKELGKDFGSDTRLDVAINFLMNKESPVTSFVTDYLRGKDAIGEEFSVTNTEDYLTKNAVAKRFIPLIVQDMISSVKENGAAKGIPMAIPGIFGVGSQTYDNADKQREGFKDINPELDRLEEVSGKEIVSKPQKTIFKGTEYEQKLDEEDYNSYVELAAKYINEDVKEEMSIEGWNELSDEDKIDIIKEISSAARKDAREELFVTEEPANAE